MAVLASNWDNLSAAVFGSLFLGCTVIGIDPAMAKDDIEHMMHLTQTSVVLCDTGVYELAKECLDGVANGAQIFTFGGQMGESEPVENLLADCGEESSFVWVNEAYKPISVTFTCPRTHLWCEGKGIFVFAPEITHGCAAFSLPA